MIGKMMGSFMSQKKNLCFLDGKEKKYEKMDQPPTETQHGPQKLPQD